MLTDDTAGEYGNEKSNIETIANVIEGHINDFEGGVSTKEEIIIALTHYVIEMSFRQQCTFAHLVRDVQVAVGLQKMNPYNKVLRTNRLNLEAKLAKKVIGTLELEKKAMKVKGEGK